MELLIFVIAALISIVCGLGMLLTGNAVHSALLLVLNFTAVAVLYLLLNAPFLAMIQITVYAGAIMVLFLFVIMLLGDEKTNVERDSLPWLRPAAIVLGVLLLLEALYLILNRSAQPAQQATIDIGAPHTLAEALFTTYLLPFEITSVLLLVALIGAVVLTLKGRVRD
jgi:NADH-quinone oxidoreductase subunit J